MHQKIVYGVDVGGTTIKFGRFSVQGMLLHGWSLVTPKENNGAGILPAIAEALKADACVSGATVLGCGLGLPGTVDANGIVHGLVNLGWGEVAVIKEFQALTGWRAAATNDANAALLGEVWKGKARGKQDVLLITIGTGLGGGLLLDGKLRSGRHGSAGEVHLVLDSSDSQLCNCGCAGCAEQFASATAMVRYANELISGGFRSSLQAPITAKDILAAAKEKDPVALAVLNRTGEALARVIAISANLLDLELCLLGGGVSAGGALLLEAVNRHYPRFAFLTMQGLPIEIASLGNDAGRLGAAKLLLDTL